MIRLTFYFSQANVGWSETWWFGGDTVTSAAGGIERYVDARVRCLFNTTSVVGVRAGVEGVNRESRLFTPGTYDLGGGIRLRVSSAGQLVPDPIPPNPETPDLIGSALQLSMVASGRKMGIRYVAGIPDEISLTEPGTFGLGNAPDWYTGYRAWKQMLILTPMRIKVANKRVTAAPGVPANPEREIVGWVARDNADAPLGFVLLTATGLDLTQTRTAVIRAVRMRNPGLRPPSGTWEVYDTETGPLAGQTTYWVRRPPGVNPADVKKPGKVRLALFDYLAPTEINEIRIRSHRRGGPFGQPRGRRRTPKYVS